MTVMKYLSSLKTDVKISLIFEDKSKIKYNQEELYQGKILPYVMYEIIEIKKRPKHHTLKIRIN